MAAVATAMVGVAAVIMDVSGLDAILPPTFFYSLSILPTSSPNQQHFERSSLCLVIFKMAVDFKRPFQGQYIRHSPVSQLSACLS